jgi:hypothetical protein
MKNILNLSAIAMLAFVANSSQATQLVKVQAINTVELVEATKLHLAQAIKLNTVILNPIEKTARAQVAMNRTHVSESSDTATKAITLAD